MKMKEKNEKSIFGRNTKASYFTMKILMVKKLDHFLLVKTR